MNKHEASIALALVRTNHPWLTILFALIVKLPWRSVIGLVSVAALGASFRWHDGGWVWRLLT